MLARASHSAYPSVLLPFFFHRNIALGANKKNRSKWAWRSHSAGQIRGGRLPAAPALARYFPADFAGKSRCPSGFLASLASFICLCSRSASGYCKISIIFQTVHTVTKNHSLAGKRIKLADDTESVLSFFFWTKIPVWTLKIGPSVAVECCGWRRAFSPGPVGDTTARPIRAMGRFDRGEDAPQNGAKEGEPPIAAGAHPG